MRSARKLMLLAIAAIAAAAVFAPTASAIDTVEVVNEKTGAHCTPATCAVHLAGVVALRIDLGIFGEAFEATCNLETVMTVSETGAGSITQVNTSAGAGQEVGCPTVTTECSMPWAASGEEDGPVGIVQSVASICVDPAESGSNCVGNLAFSVVEQAGEHSEKVFNNASVGLCELDGDLEVESANAGNADIHVNHP